MADDTTPIDESVSGRIGLEPAPSRADAEVIHGIAEWHALSPTAGRVRAIGGALGGLVASGPVGIALSSLTDGRWFRLAVVLGTMIGLTLASAALARARWRRTRWKLDDRGFHVRRGWLFRTEVLVPRTRVQHLDIERGPLERHFGLATLIVHTAGSLTPALQQSGLTEIDAVALRDALIPPSARHDDAL